MKKIRFKQRRGSFWQKKQTNSNEGKKSNEAKKKHEEKRKF